MKDKTTEDGTEVHQRMFENPPHIMPELSKILSGECELTPTLQHRMLDHLHSCIHCQITVETIASVSIRNNADNPAAGVARKELQRLKKANHRIQEQDERIAAYAETAVARGVEEANRLYPAFYEHLKQCEKCCAEVDNMRTSLVEAVNAGLISPLEEHARTRAQGLKLG